jgi:hypothetical protein
MRSADAGSLVLPTGRIVASDPLLNPWNHPFRTTVKPGTYPVHLALGDDDVALVMILFGEGPPKRWKSARPASLSVDSATGALMDYRVARFLRQKAEAGKYDRFGRLFEVSMAETGLWANVPIGSSTNAIVFRTWGGDGEFPVYFGFDEEHDPVCLVIDMLPR